jgi:hypothetical protein
VDDPYGDLTEGYLHCASALFQPNPSAPALMQRPAWGLKSISTALAAWTEVRHATALYDKDANISLGGLTERDRFYGYVEPVPVFFQRLDSLTHRFEDDLDRIGYFDKLEGWRAREKARGDTAEAVWDPASGSMEIRAERDAARRARLDLPDRARFIELEEIVDRLEDLAEWEITHPGQCVRDGAFLRTLGWRLRHLSFHTGGRPSSMAVITDPATEQLGMECLEIGTGDPATINVAVPDGDRAAVCRGPVYTFCEFTQPIAERLDDGNWQAILAGPPERRPAPWLQSRLAERGNK